MHHRALPVTSGPGLPLSAPAAGRKSDLSRPTYPRHLVTTTERCAWGRRTSAACPGSFPPRRRLHAVPLFTRQGRAWRRPSPRSLSLAGTGIGIARASDHQDNPLVELNPAMDMTDVYAFPGSSPDRIALVLNSWAFLTPRADPVDVVRSESPLPVQDRQHGRRRRKTKSSRSSFKGTGANQTVEVRGPVAPPVLGAMNNQLADATPAVTGAVNQVLGSPSGIQVFAGAREDPFFIDLEQFFRILPDRKPSTGTLSALPDTRDRRARRSAPPPRRWTSRRASTCCRSSSSCRPSMLTAVAPAKLGIWGTISR